MKSSLSTDFSTRQHMRAKDFEIYYYQDSRLPKLTEHLHDCYEFYFFKSGDVSMRIENKTYKLKPGDMLLIPPNVHHFADIHSMDVPYSRFIFWVSEAYCKTLLSLSQSYVYLMQHVKVSHMYIYHYDIIAQNAIETKLLKLIEELRFERYGKKEMVSLCAKDLILHLNRTTYEQENPASPREAEDLCRNIVTYIENHSEDDLSLAGLSREFYVSKYYISHIFKEKLGISIHRYIMKKRLSACHDAIMSGSEITEAFLKCGFRDYSGFYRAFRKEYGLSPKEYKELHTPSHGTGNDDGT